VFEGFTIPTVIALLKGAPLMAVQAWRFARRDHRHLTPAQRIAARHKWKPLFEDEIRKTFRAGLRKDVIVRDVRRVDQYPQTKEGRGISAWFRVGLVATYYRGIQLGLGWVGLTYDQELGGWRYTNYAANEEPELRAIRMGNVPYEQIEGVDWNGDEYYNCPHLYCYFDQRRQPCESIALYTEHEHPSPGNPPYYREVEDYKGIVRRTKTRKIRYL
jgi:hypothetical protein